MSNRILHSGIVESMEKDCMRVRILQTSACSACKASSHCNASEKKEKTVEVFGDYRKAFVPGETVTVVASSQVGFNAVLMGFGVPFLIMITAVFVCSRLSDSEPLMAMAGLIVLIPYYIILYLLRDKIRERLSFSVEKINN